MANEQWRDALERLTRERDELRVQMHLARAELRDDWEQLERQWEQLQVKLEAAGREAASSAGEVRAAAGTLLEELRKGYRRVRDQLH